MVRRLRRVAPAEDLCVRFPGDEEVLGQLRADLPAISAVQDSFRRGALHEAKLLLVRQFRQRRTPRFFIGAEELDQALDAITQQYPSWRERALSRQEIAAASTPASVAQWAEIPRGPGEDQLPRDRVHHFAGAVRIARAIAYGAPREEKLQTYLDSWIAYTEATRNPDGYSSCLIAVYRAIALSWAWLFLSTSEKDTTEIEFTILRILLHDARFLAKRLGTSFANNHLLADGFALWYLGTLLPEFAGAEEWKRAGEAVWLRELRRQIYEDGTSFEHSVRYHDLACELAAAYVLLKRRNGAEPEDWVIERLRRMLEFQAELSGPETATLAQGDGVEGAMFALDGFDALASSAPREILRALFAPDCPPPQSDARGSERAFWLLGGRLAPPPREPAAGAFRAFPDGGYFVFPETDPATRLVLRTGPAPEAAVMPGHMHADLHSVCLNLAGHAVIADPGTYTYRSCEGNWPAGTPPWRAHLRGAGAHSGFCLDGLDPLGPRSGDFPLTPIQSRAVGRACRSGAVLAWVESAIAGQTAYAGHRRGVVHVRGGYWLCYDVLPQAAGAGRAWIQYQLARDARLDARGARAFLVECAGQRLWIAASEAAGECSILCGSHAPLAGWLSERYGQLEPAPMLRMAVDGSHSLIATLLMAGAAVQSAPQVEALGIGGTGYGFRVTCGDRQDYLLLNADPDGKEISAWGINFAGALLLLRCQGGAARRIGWLDGTRVTVDAQRIVVEARSGALRELELRAETGGIATSGCAADQVSITGLVVPMDATRTDTD